MNQTGRCPVAYAIVVSADGGRHIAVELHKVRFEEVVFLEPNADPEHRRFAIDRLCAAATERSMNDRKTGWLPRALEHEGTKKGTS
jgi:hypothetical protein